MKLNDSLNELNTANIVKHLNPKQRLAAVMEIADSLMQDPKYAKYKEKLITMRRLASAMAIGV